MTINPPERAACDPQPAAAQCCTQFPAGEQHTALPAVPAAVEAGLPGSPLPPATGQAPDLEIPVPLIASGGTGGQVEPPPLAPVSPTAGMPSSPVEGVPAPGSPSLPVERTGGSEGQAPDGAAADNAPAALSGQEFRDRWKAVRSEQAKAARNRRGAPWPQRAANTGRRPKPGMIRRMPPDQPPGGAA